MVISGQPCAPTAPNSRNEPSLPIKQEPGRVPGPVWAVWRKGRMLRNFNYVICPQTHSEGMTWPLWQANLTHGEIDSSDDTFHLFIDILSYVFAYAVIMTTLLIILKESRFLGTIFSSLDILYLFPSKVVLTCKVTWDHACFYLIWYLYVPSYCFQWPRDLMCWSASARFLGLRFRNPPRARMSASFECCVFSGRVICNGPITRPEESYQCDVPEYDREASIMRRTWLTRGCRKVG
jgi:hypothetical protein